MAGQQSHGLNHLSGRPAGQTTGTVAAGDPVYCLLEDYTDSNSVAGIRGSFRKDTDGGLASCRACFGRRVR